MSLFDQMRLASQPDFQGRVAAAAVHTALATQTEVTVDQQSITGTATGGTGTITANGQTTSALQFNASASAIQTALNALSTIGSGGVECTGGPLGTTPVVVNFIGSNLQGAQPVMTLGTGSLTGGTWTNAHTTAGTWVLSHTKRSALASKVLANPTGYGQLMAMGIADNATVLADFQSGAYAPLTGNITNATNVNPIVITSANHGLATAQSVTITGVGGDTAANGTWSITKIDANTFSIPVAGNGAYTGGGTWVLSEAQVGSDIQFQMNSVFTSFA
jgi:hypothetical protein